MTAQEQLEELRRQRDESDRRCQRLEADRLNDLRRLETEKGERQKLYDKQVVELQKQNADRSKIDAVKQQQEQEAKKHQERIEETKRDSAVKIETENKRFQDLRAQMETVKQAEQQRLMAEMARQREEQQRKRELSQKR